MSNLTVTDLFDQLWERETTDLCKIVTQKETEHVNPNMLDVRKYIVDLANSFNEVLSTHKFSVFQWCKDGAGTQFDPSDERILAADYWIFGLRLGNPNATNRVALVCHLDTVPATKNDTWDPFNPFVQPSTEYPSGTETVQDFLVGRGTVDDKGPAMSAFIVMRALAALYDGSPKLDELQLEIIFDSSEETDMSSPQYFEAEPQCVPTFGVVYDAMWVVRAEKGGERPVFTCPATANPEGQLYVSKVISSPDNSSNTIPDWAEAEVRGSPEQLRRFHASVERKYADFVWDVPDYTPAALIADLSSSSVTLKTLVSGAQHGSAPEENLAGGANPLVSLTNFLGGLADHGEIGGNSWSSMCQYIAWMFGTRVFGEKHRPLVGHDEVFVQGNGTTYAVTKMSDDGSGGAKLELDIRYAIAHHECGWDGVTEGYLDGDKSNLEAIFAHLTAEFNSRGSASAKIASESTTIFVPDIRTPDNNDHFKSVEEAYRKVMGCDPPRFAIGGGTDAKGYPNLLAVGPLFGTSMGPPINYHGILEGAPIADMRKSSEVLFEVFKAEIESPNTRTHERIRAMIPKILHNVKRMRSKGFVQKCMH